MRVSREVSLKDFEFWGNAKITFDNLSNEEIETLEQYFDDYERDTGEILTETQLNDIFAYELDYLAEILDLSDEERELRGFN